MRPLPILVLTLLAACGGTLQGTEDDSDGETVGVDAGTPSVEYPDAGIDPTRKLCDGSAHLRLAYSGSGDELGPTPPSGIYREVGAYYLYVDGQCRYWVTDPAGDFLADGRTGVLDAAQEAELTRLVHYQSWASLGGGYTCAGTPAPGAGGATFFDGTNRPSCPYWCEPQELPHEVVEMCSAVTSLRTLLHERGVANEGPVRLYMTADAYPAPVADFVWPLATDPESLILAVDGTPSSFRIDDVTEARQLRELKATLIIKSETLPYVPIHRDDAPPLQLWVRDILPFEDDPAGPFGLGAP